ncbi:polyphenol oxidase family protein [Patescibacteria group bacterium]|nr:polyphenol oxidase family protein [Patescibacteria group bacterium]MBU2259291.1 polyphenol oxidase family protein [Patescibacteria group bacterium]
MITNPFTILAPFNDRLQVALFTKDDDIHSDEQLSQVLNIQNVAGLHQVHGNRTIRISGTLARTEEADGMITYQENLMLTVRTADCQPFIIFVPDKKILGVIHAGWRGLIAGVIPNFFKVLDIEPQHTFVAAGPSLCKTCSEFGYPEAEISKIGTEFIDGTYVDLQGAAESQLFELGVLQKNLERHPDCTRCNPEKYWTYRGGDKEAVLEGHTNVMACWLS